MARSAASYAVDLGEAMIVAGVGCRKGATAAAVTAAIEAAFARLALSIDSLDAVATAAAKGAEPGITKAAAELGVPLILVPQHDLKAAEGRTVSRSARVLELTGVSSVAETAALAAGGATTRLLAARIALGPVTCALVDTGSVP